MMMMMIDDNDNNNNNKRNNCSIAIAMFQVSPRQGFIQEEINLPGFGSFISMHEALRPE